MGLLGLFRPKQEASGDARSGPASVQFMPSQSSMDAKSQHQIRKDLLKVVLRDTLLRNGIPSAWLSIDILRTTTAQRTSGVHVRFLLLEWQPRLLVHGLAIERDFHRRLLGMDPQADRWLMGFSWQFALSDTSGCPALPHAGSWTALPTDAHQGADTLGADSASAQVISGPVRIPEFAPGAALEGTGALASEDAQKRPYARTTPGPLTKQ